MAAYSVFDTAESVSFRFPVHKLSFDFQDPFYVAGPFQLAFRVFSTSNTYCPDPGRTVVVQTATGFRVQCNGFNWAGGQRHSEGSLTANIRLTDGAWEWSIEATHPEPILRLGTVIRGVRSGRLATIEDLAGESLRNGEAAFVYPSHRIRTPSHRMMPTTLLFVHHGDGQSTYLRSLDSQVNRKIVSVFEEEQGFRIEAVYEGDATELSGRLTAPPWRLGTTADADSIVDEHLSAFGTGLIWETRPDVPAWARAVSLVVTLHGTHWTGYHFNTYDRQLEILRSIASKIEGKRILAYLAGWEGRYYYNYPIYEPDPRLGGLDGLKRLVDGAHRLGIHVVPMFGANTGNQVHIAALGLEDAIVRSPSGTPQYCSVDWNSDGYPEDYPFLNPGHPGYRDHMVSRISSLTNQAGVDGVFLDISQYWENDPAYRYYEGLSELIRRVRGDRQDYLVMGEGWYDALIRDFGVFQLWPWTKWPSVFERYCRTMYYLPESEPSRGSAGVHEWGFYPFEIPDPQRDVIPTLGVVEDTLSSSDADVDRVIQAAISYARRKGLG